MTKITKILFHSLSVLFVPLLFVSVANAVQQNGTISQGYKVAASSEKPESGALVSLTSGTSDTIELATASNAKRLVGIADANPLIAIAKDTSEAQVVISGTIMTVVSDINGQIKSGDKVTPSPVAGAGMKATSSGQVAGTAQSDFIASGVRTITDREGVKHEIHIGYVALQVGSSYYQAPGSGLIPPVIQGLADKIAGRPVSYVRIIIATVIVLIGFAGAVTLAYSAVRSSITSIGRNPLAAPNIRRELIRVLIITVIIVAGAVASAYFVLRT